MAEDGTSSQGALKEQVSPTSIKNKSSRSSCNIYTIQKKENTRGERGNAKKKCFPLSKCLCSCNKARLTSFAHISAEFAKVPRAHSLSVHARDTQSQATAGA